MPSTDRLLWLLQMALFLAVPVIMVAQGAASMLGGDVPGCGGWIFTDAAGQEHLLRPDDTGQDWCRGGNISLLSTILNLLLNFLWYAGLGAVIFCLRRIGRAMGAD